MYVAGVVSEMLREVIPCLSSVVRQMTGYTSQRRVTVRTLCN